MTVEQNGSLCRDNLVRYVLPAFELREAEEGDGRTLVTRFAVYNQWAEINSMFEGHFLERFAPGAFRKTMRERFSQLRVLLNHGHDPELGDRPIAAIEDLRDEEEGPIAEARLLDGLPDMIVDGLRKGQYGASHRFQVLRWKVEDEPEAAPHNPKGLPEHTITEAKLYEFGPVTFPAYEGATAGVRSITDDWLKAEICQDPERRDLLRSWLDEAVPLERSTDPDPECDRDRDTADAPSTADAGDDTVSTSEPERREPRAPSALNLNTGRPRSALDV